MPGIQLVRLRPPLGTTQGCGVGGLCQVRLDAGSLEFLNDEAPPGAAFDRQRGGASLQLGKPVSELISGAGIDSASTKLAAFRINVLECDLRSVDIQPTNDRHLMTSSQRRLSDAQHARSLTRPHAIYEWVFEGDITACFDEIDHAGLMDRVRKRIGDKRVLELVRAFLKAGILSEDGIERDTSTGTPQGGILSPLLANIALSSLDEYFAQAWEAMGSTSAARQARRRKGQATYRLVRYADDFVIVVAGTRAHVEGLRGEVAAVLAPMGLRLSETKTRICHIDEGFDFLGFRIQRQRKRGTGQRFVYTYPSKTALATVKAKVRSATRGATNQSLDILLYRLNPVLRGWTNYFRHGVSKATFSYLRAFTWRRVVCWLRHKHGRVSWKWLRRRYLPGWWPTEGESTLFNPEAVTVSRYRYRANRIPSPWTVSDTKGSVA